MAFGGNECLAIAALAVGVLVVIAWFGRARPDDLAGFWASSDGGSFYEIRPGLGRGFIVHSSSRRAKGAITCLQTVNVGQMRGRYHGPRRIVWDRGEIWVRQGV